MKIHRQIAHKSKKERRCRKCSTPINIGEVYYWIKHRNMQPENFCKIHFPKAKDLTTSDKLRSLYEAQESLENAISTFENVDVSEAAEWQGTPQPTEPDVDKGDEHYESNMAAMDEWETALVEWQENEDKYKEACDKLDSALSDLASELESIEGSVREVADGYHEGADAQEEYFPGSSQAQENREKGDKAEEWADAINAAASEVEDLRGEIDEDNRVSSRNLTEIYDEAVSTAQSSLDTADF